MENKKCLLCKTLISGEEYKENHGLCNKDTAIRDREDFKVEYLKKENIINRNII